MWRKSIAFFGNQLNKDESHLFFTCPITHQIWKRWYNLFGISSVLPGTAEAHFRQYQHGMCGKSILVCWSVAWSAIMWNKQLQRNVTIFEGKNLDREQLWHKILFTMWSWMKAYQNFPYSFQQQQSNTASYMLVELKLCGKGCAWFFACNSFHISKGIESLYIQPVKLVQDKIRLSYCQRGDCICCSVSCHVQVGIMLAIYVYIIGHNIVILFSTSCAINEFSVGD